MQWTKPLFHCLRRGYRDCASRFGQLGALGGQAVARRKVRKGSVFERDAAGAAWRGTARAEGWELVGAFVTERESQTDALTIPHSACNAAEPGSLPGIVCIDDSR
ncbi:hypothetical protein QFZ96_000018 [Paraburkholderia youngii]